MAPSRHFPVRSDAGTFWIRRFHDIAVPRYSLSNLSGLVRPEREAMLSEARELLPLSDSHPRPPEPGVQDTTIFLIGGRGASP